MQYVLVRADIAANMTIVLCWYFQRELIGTNTYKLQAWTVSENVVVDGHGCHTALNCGVKANENQDKLPTLYW